MSEVDSAADQAPTRLFLGALIALTFVMNTIGRGVSETFAVFLLPVETGLGLTRAEISGTYSVYMLAYGFSAPFAGQLIDRFGARATYAFGLLSLGLGYLAGGSATGAGVSMCVMIFPTRRHRAESVAIDKRTTAERSTNPMGRRGD